MSDRLDDRVAIVTGAGRGIGAAIAQALDAVGARVAVVARSELQLQNVASSLSNSPLVVPADLASSDAVAHMVDTVLDSAGRVDIVVNNAATAIAAPATKLTLEQWQQSMDVNLRSAFLISQRVIHDMSRRQWGRIVNVSSIFADRTDRWTTAYAASKAGIIGLTRALAVECAPLGINVNAVAPGWIATDMTRTLVADPDFDERVRKATPKGRWGQPSEV